MLNIGHRGASGLAPEHTLPAYDLALKLGADYIEQDLQLTKDKHLVVLHDETLDRTARGPAANCTGRVDQKTLAQIKTCDVGSWFNAAFPALAKPSYVGLRIPTLRQVFRRYHRKANFYIETKSPETADRMEERLLRLMKAFKLRKPAATHWKVLIQSFSPASLQKVHKLDRRLPLIQLYAAGTHQRGAPGAAGHRAQLRRGHRPLLRVGRRAPHRSGPRALPRRPSLHRQRRAADDVADHGRGRRHVHELPRPPEHRARCQGACPGKLAAKRAAQARRACLRAAKRR